MGKKRREKVHNNPKLKTILSYNVKSLQDSIQKLEGEIKVFYSIKDKCNKDEDVKFWSKTIKNAERDIVKLRKYIELIEVNGNGNTV